MRVIPSAERLFLRRRFPRHSVRCGPSTLRVPQIKINKPIIGDAERRLHRFELTSRRSEPRGRDSIPRLLPTGGHPSQFLFPRAERSRWRTTGQNGARCEAPTPSYSRITTTRRLLVLANKRAPATRIQPAVKDANGSFSV